MIRSLNLDQLGKRIDLVDEFILILIAHRMELSLNVAAYKQSCNPPMPIHRQDKEQERLDKAQEIGLKLGLEPNFVFSMLYNLIGESCKKQMIELQGQFKKLPDTDDEEEWFAILRNNLSDLTKLVAPEYDSSYSGEFFASRQYKDFEERTLAQELAMLAPEYLAIDLGCATGERTLRLAEDFQKVIGYDISPEMIEVANSKIDQGNSGKVSFEVVDLENGIPLPDCSVSFVNMNLGTASDIRNIAFLIKEVERVLVPEGGFLFSFYNSGALVYQWDFLPWNLSMAAEVNKDKKCLDVRHGKKVFSVPARPYSLEEFKNFFPKTLNLIEIKTYPTLGSVLPNRLFLSKEVNEAILKIDEELSSQERKESNEHKLGSGYGAYGIALGAKVR